MASDSANDIAELVSTLASVEAVLDLDAMRKEADGLRERSVDPTLWEDPDQAQEVTRRLSYLDAELSRLEVLHSGLRTPR
jgi:peptide chain release factor 2